MADEREITIVLRGKNLTKAEFDAARKELAGVTAETEKAKAQTLGLGQAFKALAPALTIGALTAYVGKVLDAAGQISDLSAQTGLTTRSIQEMKHAAMLTGASLESFTNAAFKLGTNLDGGTSSVRHAVDRLGLSYEHLKTLSPDDQFNQIATALGFVENAQERNRIAVDLFGKAAKDILPAVAQGWDLVRDGANVATDAQIQNLDSLGDYLGIVAAKADYFGGQGVDAIVTFGRAIGIALGLAENPLKETENRLNRVAESLATTEGAAALLGVRFREMHGNVSAIPKPIEDVSISMDKADRISKELTKDIESKNKAFGDSAKAYAKDLAESQVWVTQSLLMQAQFKGLDARMEDYVTNAYTAADATADLWEQFYRLRGEAQLIGPALLQSTLNLGNMWAPLKAGLTDAKASVKGLGAAIKTGLGDVLKSVPNTLARAFEGGGNWLGAAKSLGSQFGSVIGENIGKSFAALGALGGPIGSALGSLVGPLIGKIAGLFTSKNTQEVKAYNVEIGKVWSTLYGTYGTLDELEAKAQAVGLSFKDKLGHQGKMGLEAMNTLAAEFKKRWDEANGSLETANSELDALITRGADLGYEFDQAGNLVRVNFQKMQEAAQKYGVDLGSLGPAFQGQRLHQSAEQIINDFTLLTKGGADVGGVLSGMKDEISALVRDSIKFGTDIPANMQPWIEELQRSGQLTDENGEKITDLTGIKFGEPIATEFAKITTKLEEVIGKISELVDRLSTTLAPAVDAATRDRTIRIGFKVDDVPEIDIDGGGRESRGFARGTFGTLGVDFPDFGDGTRAVVHGREAIVPYAERFAFAERVRSGSGGGASSAAPQVKIDVHFVNDNTGPRQVTEAEFRQIQDRVNSGGITVPVRSISQRGR